MRLQTFRRLDDTERRLRQLERNEPEEGGGGGGGDHPDSDHADAFSALGHAHSGVYAPLEHDTAHDDRFSLLAHTHAVHADSDHDDRFSLLAHLHAGVYAPVAAGIPTGGTTGQVLTKDTATDLDTSWATPAGGAGVGAWQTSISYGTGWAASTTGGDQAPRYRLEGDLVRLDGSATRTSGSGAPMFTLPSGFRPASLKRFWVACGGTAQGRVAIDSGGVVSQTAGADFTRTTLDGITFPIT